MEQASVYAAAKFRQSNGYQILRDVTHDALVKKVGFTKTYWAEYEQPKVYTFKDLDDDQYQAILTAPGVDEDPSREPVQVERKRPEPLVKEQDGDPPLRGSRPRMPTPQRTGSQPPQAEQSRARAHAEMLPSGTGPRRDSNRQPGR